MQFWICFAPEWFRGWPGLVYLKVEALAMDIFCSTCDYSFQKKWTYRQSRAECHHKKLKKYEYIKGTFVFLDDIGLIKVPHGRKMQFCINYKVAKNDKTLRLAKRTSLPLLSVAPVFCSPLWRWCWRYSLRLDLWILYYRSNKNLCTAAELPRTAGAHFAAQKWSRKKTGQGHTIWTHKFTSGVRNLEFHRLQCTIVG